MSSKKTETCNNAEKRIWWKGMMEEKIKSKKEKMWNSQLSVTLQH